MSKEKIGMYTAEEIYEELANGFLHHSMVDAMYFQIKDLQQKVEQLENIRKEAIESIENGKYTVFKKDIETIYEQANNEFLNILNKGSESNVKD